MKRLMTLILAAGLTLGMATASQAIEFKVDGEWLMGFAVGEKSLVNKVRADDGVKRTTNADDKFSALQRVRLQLQAVVSEDLSGTIQLELGDTIWGQAATGGAVGTDGKICEVKFAYIDWAVPDTSLTFRMGLQQFTLPNVAGGSAVLDDDVAAIVANYEINNNVGVTLSWLRPLNDNYVANAQEKHSKNKTNYLDNVDLFALSVPMNFDGIEVTPWLMYGIFGQNALFANDASAELVRAFSTSSYNAKNRWNTNEVVGRTEHGYTGGFWFGLPIRLSLWDPLNIEFDFNYGYVASQGRGYIQRSDRDMAQRFSTKREGWLAKALVEYKMDWGTPGIFGWYASGDDDNPKNGSERMPSIDPSGNFTSILGDGNLGWGGDQLYDRNLSYAGTWGVGLQVSDMSFIDDLTHTFRVALWGGTNSPKMAKYARSAVSWNNVDEHSNFNDYNNELYLTTNDHLLEFNLINSYAIYANLEMNLELGYVVNMIDHDTWKKANGRDTFEKQDMFKAQVVFRYTF